jgi:hypothetical protein
VGYPRKKIDSVAGLVGQHPKQSVRMPIIRINMAVAPKKASGVKWLLFKDWRNKSIRVSEEQWLKSMDYTGKYAKKVVAYDNEENYYEMVIPTTKNDWEALQEHIKTCSAIKRFEN